MADWNIKVSHPMNRVWKHERGYLEGHIITEHGIVFAYSQGGENEKSHTTLQFVWEGRLYSKDYPRRYTQRGLVTLANRFAEEVRWNT